MNSTKVIVPVLIFLVMLIVTPTCLVQCTRVDTAEVGIKFNKLSYDNQGRLDATTCSGYTFYNPITTDVYTYPTCVQRVDYKPFTVTTQDAAVFSMDPTLAYMLNRDKSIYVFQKYRKSLTEIQSGYMRTAIWDAYRITANRYTSDSLMANRANFENEVRAMLEKSLGDEGFIVCEFTSKIDPPASLRQMIDEKNAAVQAALKAENKVKEAEAEAKIAQAKAKGKAEALKIEADGEAYYNRTVAASLNEVLIRQYAIEKWDGKLPTTTAGGSVPIVNLK